MITKPISLSPDSETISITDGTLTLTSEVHTGSTLETFTENGKEYCYASLVLRANNRDYVFTRPYGVSGTDSTYVKARVERQTHSIKVIIELDLNSTMVGIARVGRWSTDDKGNDKYTQKIYRNPKLGDLISIGSQLSWKVRLFEKKSLSSNTYIAKNIVGYGTINSVTRRNSSDETPVDEMVIAIAPHTNIYDAVIGANYIDSVIGIRTEAISEQKKITRRYIIEALTNIMKHYDANMRYYVNINGKQIPIKYYRLYPATSKDEDIFSTLDGDNGQNYYLKIAKHFDGYGNPLAGYAVVDYSAELENAIQEGDTYQICCNYIDSANAYFEVHSEPVIKQSDGFHREGGERDVSPAEGIDYEMCTSHFDGWGASNINWQLSFTQAEGIEVAYYSYKVYKYNSPFKNNSTDSRLRDPYNKQWITLIYSSGNIYSQELLCSYDGLQNDTYYRIVATIVDTTGRSYEVYNWYYVLFEHAEADGYTDGYATAEYYPEHNSIIIDWSDIDKYLGEDMSKITGFKVFKTLGDNTEFHEVANIEGTNYCVLEDFVVGDNCKYTYHVQPLMANKYYRKKEQDYKDVDGVNAVFKPLRTNDITLNYGIDKVFALNKIDDRVYEVNLNWIWRLYLNLGDNGFNINNDKTFYDTLATYTQESVGNRKYITKSVSGLIGTIDCGSREQYVDTYDMLISWNKFATSADLKCFIDIRGLILPGNFETNPSIEYLEGSGSPANAKFNWRQKSDLDIIKIYGTLLPFNPMKNTYLHSSDKFSLWSNETNSVEMNNGLLLYGQEE